MTQLSTLNNSARWVDPRLGVGFTFEPGAFDDYHALGEFHYLGKRPATVCAVWRIKVNAECGIRNSELPQQLPAGGLVHRVGGGAVAGAACSANGTARGTDAAEKAVIPHSEFPIPHSSNSAFRIPHSAFETVPHSTPLWRFGGYPVLAAVAVVSYPTLNAKARDVASGGRYRTRPPGPGVRRLNAEVRTISRVIVHPLYRGLGLATRLVAGVLERTDAAWVEAFARMGAYVPFFARAGMRELRLAGRPVYYFRETGVRGQGSGVS